MAGTEMRRIVGSLSTGSTIRRQRRWWGFGFRLTKSQQLPRSDITMLIFRTIDNFTKVIRACPIVTIF
jgi:hypothetical protein